MSAYCCWYWCNQPRALSATELLVAASFNTAVKRISRANSEDSLSNVSLRYNTFVVPPPRSPCANRKSCPPIKSDDSSKEDKSHAEMMALVQPLKRNQERRKISERISERETLQMSYRENRHSYIQSSSEDGDARSMGGQSDDNSRYGVSEDGIILAPSGHVIGFDADEDEDYEEENDAMEGKSPEYPLDECFGSVIVCSRQISAKAVGVLVVQLQGLPWVGPNEGLSVEVRAVGAAKSQWIFLPNAKGPEVKVQREVTLKLARPKSSEEFMGSFHPSNYSPTIEEEQVPTDPVLVTVWSGCGSHARYSAIGHAVVPTRGKENNNSTRIIALQGHTKVHPELGSIELSLTSSSISSNNNTRNRGILLKILGARGLQKPSFHWIAKKASKTLSDRDRLDVWCTVTLWIAGEKIKKVFTPKTPMPVTCDPEFKASCTFFVPKQEQHKACIVIKIHCGRSLNEVMIGRAVLGPYLYLGSHRHPPLLPLDTSSPRPVTLSHWGKSLNSHYPVTAWHRLRY